MARRSDHSREQLKDLILDKAWEIVGHEGIESLTARRLATEIGYVPGTIYNIFRSMDELRLAIAGRTLDTLYGVLNSPECNDPDKSPIENMKAMAMLYMKFAAEKRPYWLMLFSPTLPETRAEEEWYQAKINHLFEPLGHLLEPLFPDTERKKAHMAARVLWASVHGLCFLQETGKMGVVGDRAGLHSMVSLLIDTFVAGLQKNV